MLKETLLLEGSTKIRNYKYRIYPTDAQQDTLSQWFGMCRYVYNKHLATDREFYELNKDDLKHPKSLTYVQMCGWVTHLRNDSPTSWLADCPIDALQNSLRTYQVARTNFFRDPGHVGMPKFKSRYDSRQSLAFNKTISVIDDVLNIPKLKGVRIKLHRPIVGDIKTVRIVRNADGTYDAVLTLHQDKYGRPMLVTEATSPVGIDLGIKDTAVCSSGIVFPNPKYVYAAESKLKYLQRRFAKKRKPHCITNKATGETTRYVSSGYAKAKIALARAHSALARKRKHYLHTISSRIANAHDLVFLENLNILGMLTNHCLARAISDASWGTLVGMIKYKVRDLGGRVLHIDRWFASSKKCSTPKCDYVNQDLTLKDRFWECPKCHTLHDRDQNASNNILNEGLRAHEDLCKEHGCTDVSFYPVA